MQASLFVALGLLAGCLSGLIGIGGGVILVPALIFFFGMSQHLAQGTTLALMVPPIGFLAAWSIINKATSICVLRLLFVWASSSVDSAALS